jgi:hypothetical protein
MSGSSAAGGSVLRDDSLSVADAQVKATPAVRAWAKAYREWWDVLLAGAVNERHEQHLRAAAFHAWLDLNEPERQSAWSWYRANYPQAAA